MLVLSAASATFAAFPAVRSSYVAATVPWFLPTAFKLPASNGVTHVRNIYAKLHLSHTCTGAVAKGLNYAKVVVMQRCHAVGTNLHPTPTGICGASESTNALRLRPDLG